MRRSPPASTQLPALAERKRPRAELTPDAGGENDVPLVLFVPHTPLTRPASPETLRATAVLSLAPWRPDAAVRAPPRLESLES